MEPWSQSIKFNSTFEYCHSLVNMCGDGHSLGKCPAYVFYNFQLVSSPGDPIIHGLERGTGLWNDDYTVPGERRGPGHMAAEPSASRCPRASFCSVEWQGRRSASVEHLGPTQATQGRPARERGPGRTCQRRLCVEVVQLVNDPTVRPTVTVC